MAQTTTIKPQPGPQETFLSTPADVALYGGAAGGGKILANEGLILTPFGWKMGRDLNVGDLVNNPDGTVQRIIQIKPEVTLEKWTVFFSDGTFTEVAADHLWQAWRGRKGRKIKNERVFGEASAEVIETRELKQWLERGYNPQIPVCSPQPFNRTTNEKNPIDPYLLGILLGDGCITSVNVMITCHDDEKQHYVNHIGVDGINTTTPRTIRFVGERNKELIKKLQLHGLYGRKSHDKFVPEVYKYSSIESRFALVQGLMDTDGWSAPDKQACYFDTISNRLADDMAFVLRSLGAVVTITKGEGSYKNGDGEKVKCQDVYHLYIKFSDPNSLFRLDRKQHGAFGKALVQKRVVDVVVGGTITGRCITVSNPNGLYITNDFIVTHNSFALLLEALRWIGHPGYGAVIFRRTSVQVRNEGSLWDTSESFYPFAGGTPSESTLEWKFPAGTSIKFAHMEHEKNKLDWQGSQITLIGFDELTHFTESQFFYMLSRNRSTCGVRPYIRATTNPDADSWVAEFIEWYIGEDGYPIKERSGAIRWFIRVDGNVIWGDSSEELKERYPGTSPKSFTFISAKLEDNQILMQKDPSYKANLEALPLVEKERLLGGNWKIKPAAGLYFKREWFSDKFVDEAPKCSRYVRFWDCAATDAKNADDPDYTVGVKMGELNGQYYIIDVQRFRKSPGAADEHMRQTAFSDGREVMIREEEEPGSSGKRVIATHATTIFKGFNFVGIKSTGSKIVRAGPVSAACQNGNVYLVKGSWNNEFLSELEGFPERKHDDQVDGLSGAFNALFSRPAKVPKFTAGFGVVGGGMRI